MKKYKFSVTKNYVSSWGVSEAIREILQNAYDSSAQEIIDFNDDYISIKNLNIQLPIKILLMGYGTKTNDSSKVGGFNEGSLLSLLVLTREGCNIVIHNGNEDWIPSFEYDEELGEEVLCVNVCEGNITNQDLEYRIDNISQYIINELRDEFVGINNESYGSISTMYGEILTDKKYKGKIFVNNLPVMQDNKFDYGYNFKPEYVNLDRDRKSINLRELYEITSLAVVYMDNRDFNMVDNLIDGTSDDAHYLRDRNISLPKDYVEEYSKHLRERFGVDDNTIVVNEASKEVIEELKRKQADDETISFITTPKAVYADVLNRTSSYSSNYLNELHNEMTHRTAIEEAQDYYRCSSYKSFKEWFDRCSQVVIFSSQMRNDFKDILSNIEPAYFDLIEDEVWNNEQ